MDEATFWKLIDQSRETADADPDEQLEHLEAMLRDLAPEEIVDFDRLFTEFHQQAYTWPLWGAAYLIGGGCSDDGFMDFRGWLISRGKKVYDTALASPDSLAGVVGEDEETQVEGFQYLPRQAWAEVTGEDEDSFPEHGIAHPEEPAGSEWSEDELDSLYPKLAKKFA
jgi:hypothetical protein